eukprot:TRINITY_DN6376_c0_g1_i2.p2 TRINITY_DN6376_c0_g1~~TRINITY_DN6376_c0_g1_i2.p2  ORF type:complete len:306 (+),score=66.69 TRINITY_DN6376_c0_g1_i2:110-1027(+)
MQFLILFLVGLVSATPYDYDYKEDYKKPVFDRKFVFEKPKGFLDAKNITKTFDFSDVFTHEAAAAGSAAAVTSDFEDTKKYRYDHKKDKDLREAFVMTNADKKKKTASVLAGAIAEGGDQGQATSAGDARVSLSDTKTESKSLREYKIRKGDAKHFEKDDKKKPYPKPEPYPYVYEEEPYPYMPYPYPYPYPYEDKKYDDYKKYDGYDMKYDDFYKYGYKDYGYDDYYPKKYDDYYPKYDDYYPKKYDDYYDYYPKKYDDYYPKKYDDYYPDYLKKGYDYLDYGKKEYDYYMKELEDVLGKKKGY